MSDTVNPATATQPMPEQTTEVYVQQLVMNDIIERLKFGIKKYGTGLQAHNGRDHLWDAYEEALDLVMYLRAEIEKRGGALKPCPTCQGRGVFTRGSMIVGGGSSETACTVCEGQGWIKQSG